jgi:hypothetical protein
MNITEAGSFVEPSEWFIVFHRKSLNAVLAFLAFGEFKHVSAFGYCPGVKLWLVYDVQWSGTRTILMDTDAITIWTRNCTILKIAHTGKRMGWSCRIGFYCVNAVKHLIGLRCGAVTPDQFYHKILQSGGIVISEYGQSAAADA